MGDGEARLAELLGSLSLATDIAAGLGAETALRTAVYAVRLAGAAGLQGFELADTYYAGLLRFIGCTAYSHEMAWRYGAGDDLGILRALNPTDVRQPGRLLAQAARGMNPEAPALARAASFARLAANPRLPAEIGSAHCDLAVRLAARLGMSQGVVATLNEMYERWDGSGSPGRIRGEAIRAGARVLHVAWRLAANAPGEGFAAAIETLRGRAGTELDPRLVEIAVRAAGDLGRGLDGGSVWDVFLGSEPAPTLWAGPARLPAVALAFAQYVDVKSPFTLGHSTGVAELARAAASEGDRERVHTAALLHDLGRVAIPNGIWDKPGRLDARERDLAESHVYETERILKRSLLLAPYARLAGLHHERLDGRGYHRGLAGTSIDPAARLLAAADVYQALVSDRAYRPAHSPEAAAAALAEEARDGRLDRAAVEAVLAAAGHAAVKLRGAWPSGLTDREVEVIRLVGRGLSNKEVGARLFISPKTVKRHLESIYGKTGVRSRAAAAVFAVDQGLV